MAGLSVERLSPQELLNHAPVHTIGETALILGLRRRDGTPNRRVVHELIRSGAIRVVDPDQPVTRRTVSSAEIYRYVNEGPRRGADIIELRGVS